MGKIWSIIYLPRTSNCCKSWALVSKVWVLCRIALLYPRHSGVHGPGTTPPAGKPCYRCGKGHHPSKCKFREAVCRKCRKKGHIKAACLSKSKKPSQLPPTKVNTVDDGDCESLNIVIIIITWLNLWKIHSLWYLVFKSTNWRS